MTFDAVARSAYEPSLGAETRLHAGGPDYYVGRFAAGVIIFMGIGAVETCRASVHERESSEWANVAVIFDSKLTSLERALRACVIPMIAFHSR